MVDRGRVVHELGDFFFERQAGDQIVDAGFGEGGGGFVGLGVGWGEHKEADCRRQDGGDFFDLLRVVSEPGFSAGFGLEGQREDEGE
jgi:hypothetical protein